MTIGTREVYLHIAEDCFDLCANMLLYAVESRPWLQTMGFYYVYCQSRCPIAQSKATRTKGRAYLNTYEEGPQSPNTRIARSGSIGPDAIIFWLSTQGELQKGKVADHASLTATAATTPIICLEHQARAGNKLRTHPNAHPMSVQLKSQMYTLLSSLLETIHFPPMTHMS